MSNTSFDQIFRPDLSSALHLLCNTIAWRPRRHLTFTAGRSGLYRQKKIKVGI